ATTLLLGVFMTSLTTLGRVEGWSPLVIQWARPRRMSSGWMPSLRRVLISLATCPMTRLGGRLGQRSSHSPMRVWAVMGGVCGAVAPEDVVFGSLSCTRRHPSPFTPTPTPTPDPSGKGSGNPSRSEEHTSELQSRENLVCRLLLEKKNTN